MIPHQRRQASHNNHPFSFSNSKQNLSDEVAYRRWADLIKTSYSSGRIGPWVAPSSTRRYDDEDDDDDSDVPSPPLWERRSKEEEEIREGKKYRPSSRGQAVARYRQEMMDSVKDVPENAYELSLKDMVEPPRTVGLQSPTIEEKITEETIKKGRKKKAKKVSRSESLHAGVFLFKMFVMPSFGRKQSFDGGGCGTPAKSLKPANTNKLSECSGSSSSRSSSTRRKISGCFPIFGSHRNKALEY